MTQKCVYRLVDKLINGYDGLKHSQVLLVIAREQLDLEPSDVLERVDILLELYLNSLDYYFDELKPVLNDLKILSLTVSSSDG